MKFDTLCQCLNTVQCYLISCDLESIPKDLENMLLSKYKQQTLVPS